MKEKFKEIWQKAKSWVNEIFVDDGGTGDFVETNVQTKKINKKEKVIQIIEKKYISREVAINIADMEENLRKSMYLDGKRNGCNYGLIEISDYYATLVKYNGKFAWYIKVADGMYGKKDGNKFLRGYFDEDSNISCIVVADSGKYIYLGKNFDTRVIRMVNDEEFLYYINNVRHM